MPRQLSTGPHMITTSPSPTVCRSCRRPILAATVAGLDRHIDLATLNDEGELAALISGRTTYQLHGELLVERNHLKLAQPRPAVPVLADHSCQPVPTSHVDQAFTYKAMVLLADLLGGTLVSDTGDTPPF